AAPEPPAAKAPPPPAPPAPEPPAPAPPVAPGFDDDDDDEGATMVAQVPEELLAAAAERNQEAAHFKEVFEQFVAMKKQCGEPTAGLTYEKFSQTLKKNRDAIVSKHGAKSVRFTVYEKNGKAALKATPVKG
ncbi:MAG TPA: MXAN_5187 C-terminal domain-containing protein, partial [Polyangiaceae bacterium LLY-WYZ-15_(1-7)]|nr:MXAN_5187 C-terminal domain-containing protein [Polyangiaceae bacterium LLY-WYZ-15_(1-7)]